MESIPEILQEFTSKFMDIATSGSMKGLKEIVQETQSEINSAGLRLLRLVIESMDEKIYEERERGKEWLVVRKGDVKRIMTSRSCQPTVGNQMAG